MNWWGWLLFAVYVIGWGMATRRIGWLIADDLTLHGRIEGEDVAFGLFLGSLVALFWPVIYPLYRTYRFATEHGHATGGLLVPPEHVKKRERLAAREREVREREERIARMERELGVGK